MKKTLYCGVDLHSNNAMYFIADNKDKPLFRKRLNNHLPTVLEALEPFRKKLNIVAVESTYNWYWLVDGLMAAGFPVSLANPAAIQQYNGIKDADDLTDAAFLARLARLDILPTGYIYPKEDRPVRDMLRRRMLIVQHRTATILSLQNMFLREMGRKRQWKTIAKLNPKDHTEDFAKNEYLLFVVTQQSDLIAQLSDKIRLFEDKIMQRAKLKPEYEPLLTIPGIGKILGLTIMLETGSVTRFPKAGNYTSYCRCVRANRTSNGKSKGLNNGKNGNRYLAWAFVEAAHHALATCPQAKRFYDRKKSKCNGALATKALAAKWTKAAYYVMKHQEAFDLKRVFG
jgi:transposase